MTNSMRKAIIANLGKRPLNETEMKVQERGEKMHRGLKSGHGTVLWPVESRAYTTLTAKEIVGEIKNATTLPLEDSALGKAGASFLTGLKGNSIYIDNNGVIVGWKNETAEADDAGGKFKSALELSPKRLTAKVIVSKQLLFQDSIDIDILIEKMLIDAVIDKVEETALSALPKTADRPAGIFQGPTSKGEIDWTNIASMENTLDANKTLKGNLAYITHPTLLTTAKTKLIEKAVGGGYIGNGTINDYPVYKSSRIPKTLGVGEDETGIILANWAEFVVGQWGALEITSNPYTYAVEGLVELTVNSFWDFGMIRKEAFAINSMK